VPRRSSSRARASGAVLALLLLAAGLAACGIDDLPNESGSTTTEGTASSGPRPTEDEPDDPDAPDGALVSPDEARDAVDAFMEATNEANATIDTGLLVDIETGAAAAIDEAWFRGLRNEGGTAVTFTWEKEGIEVYVPRATEYPISFLATVEYVGDEGRDGIQVQVLEKASPSANWKLANYANMAPGTALPQLDLDDEGYLTEFDPADLAFELETLPTELGKLMQDEAAESRVDSSRAVDDVRTNITTRFADDVKPTINHQITYDTPAAPGYPTYAFPLADGGALVMGVLGVRETITPVTAGTPIDVDSDVTSGLVPTGKYTKVEMRSLVGFLGTVPGADEPEGKAEVIAMLPGTITASAS
jgi:hypothetical protein